MKKTLLSIVIIIMFFGSNTAFAEEPKSGGKFAYDKVFTLTADQEVITEKLPAGAYVLTHEGGCIRNYWQGKEQWNGGVISGEPDGYGRVRYGTSWGTFRYQPTLEECNAAHKGAKFPLTRRFPGALAFRASGSASWRHTGAVSFRLTFIGEEPPIRVVKKLLGARPVISTTKEISSFGEIKIAEKLRAGDFLYLSSDPEGKNLAALCSSGYSIETTQSKDECDKIGKIPSSVPLKGLNPLFYSLYDVPPFNKQIHPSSIIERNVEEKEFSRNIGLAPIEDFKYNKKTRFLERIGWRYGNSDVYLIIRNPLAGFAPPERSPSTISLSCPQKVEHRERFDLKGAISPSHNLTNLTIGRGFKGNKTLECSNTNPGNEFPIEEGAISTKTNLASRYASGFTPAGDGVYSFQSKWNGDDDHEGAQSDVCEVSVGSCLVCIYAETEGVGHGFIKIKRPEDVFEGIGFYPGMRGASPPVIGTMGVISGHMEDDSKHPWDHKVCYRVPRDKCGDIRLFADNYPKSISYNLLGNNCTHFVQDAAWYIGVYPSAGTSGGLAKWIKNQPNAISLSEVINQCQSKFPRARYDKTHRYLDSDPPELKINDRLTARTSFRNFVDLLTSSLARLNFQNILGRQTLKIAEGAEKKELPHCDINQLPANFNVSAGRLPEEIQKNFGNQRVAVKVSVPKSTTDGTASLSMRTKEYGLIFKNGKLTTIEEGVSNPTLKMDIQQTSKSIQTKLELPKELQPIASEFYFLALEYASWMRAPENKIIISQNGKVVREDNVSILTVEDYFAGKISLDALKKEMAPFDEPLPDLTISNANFVSPNEISFNYANIGKGDLPKSSLPLSFWFEWVDAQGQRIQDHLYWHDKAAPVMKVSDFYTFASANIKAFSSRGEFSLADILLNPPPEATHLKIHIDGPNVVKELNENNNIVLVSKPITSSPELAVTLSVSAFRPGAGAVLPFANAGMILALLAFLSSTLILQIHHGRRGITKMFAGIWPLLFLSAKSSYRRIQNCDFRKCKGNHFNRHEDLQRFMRVAALTAAFAISFIVSWPMLGPALAESSAVYPGDRLLATLAVKNIGNGRAQGIAIIFSCPIGSAREGATALNGQKVSQDPSQGVTAPDLEVGREHRLVTTCVVKDSAPKGGQLEFVGSVSASGAATPFVSNKVRLIILSSLEPKEEQKETKPAEEPDLSKDKPDLNIVGTGFLPSIEIVEKDQALFPVIFSAIVKNSSQADAANFSTRVRVDIGNNGTWEIVSPKPEETAVLKAGEQMHVKLPLEWIAPIGNYAFEICVDFLKNISESDETNNCATERFTLAIGEEPYIEEELVE